MVELIFIFIYEGLILILMTILLILILKKYLERREKLTLYLLISFTFFTLAIFFSWLSKTLVLYSNIGYIKDIDKPTDPGTLESWFVLRIVDFRFAIIAATIGIYYSYVFKVKIFQGDYNKTHRIIVISFAIWTIIVNLFFYVVGNQLLIAFAFFFLFVYMSMVYFPFMKCAIHNYLEVEDPIIKKAFMSLTIMSICLALIFFFFTIDRVLIIIGWPRFTVFYFLAWIAVLTGMLGTYLGYILPKKSDEE